MSRIAFAYKALRELGPRQLGLYGLYQLGLRSGYFRRVMPDPGPAAGEPPVLNNSFLNLPAIESLEKALGDVGRARLLAEADEIVQGQARLFGGAPIPLRLTVPAPLAHWSEYERDHRLLETVLEDSVADIKFIWEPARFGWAYTLGRAYRLSGDERYAAAFWEFAEKFLDANPPYRGPHWSSAQEAALRLMAFAFAGAVFDSSAHTTPARAERLARTIAWHAERIPPTMVYARAQNNNHLLSEASGLYTAALALPGHPAAPRWRALGWRWFNRGIRAQVDSSGAYTQHSTNYHRLMLQLALWVATLAGGAGEDFPRLTKERLAAGTRWLLGLLDPTSGRTPNLGANDGAYILPLTARPFHDYRPTLQAAGEAFLGERLFAETGFDEMSLWLPPGKGFSQGQPPFISDITTRHHPAHVLGWKSGDVWAYLRVAAFSGRPGHADQLHLDLWHHGSNVAQDAGAYLYNTPAPWDNALARAQVHNTLTVNGLDQMTRAGRFLYVDRAQARLLAQERAEDGAWEQVAAQHDGYRRLGVLHRRTVRGQTDGLWRVEDRLLPIQPSHPPAGPFSACLHWLLPDWPWDLQIGNNDIVLRLESPSGEITLEVASAGQSQGGKFHTQLARAGELLSGAGDVSPVWGWSSPTYGDKIPALALRATVSGVLPLSISSVWRFPTAQRAQE